MKKRIRPVFLVATLTSVVLFSIAPVTAAASDMQPDVPALRHIPVRSMAVASIAYDPATRTLEVVFRKGQVWRYFDVPPSVHRDFLAAESKGRFYNKSIRKHFKSVKPQAGSASR